MLRRCGNIKCHRVCEASDEKVYVNKDGILRAADVVIGCGLGFRLGSPWSWCSCVHC